MQFLLVALNAKYIHSNPGLYSLRAYADKMLCQNEADCDEVMEIQIAEYTINNRMEDILSDLYKRNPDVIGFSCYIWNFVKIQDIVRQLHKLKPDLPIWLGGPEVSYEGEAILEQYPYLAGIIMGEGEKTFAELLSYYQNGTKRLCDIAGLLLPGGIRTACRELLSMEELPFLYTELAPFQNRIIYYESQRGCPFRCSYCLSSIDKTVRFRDMETVKRELQFFLDNAVAQVKFVDRTFNCNHRHAMAIWEYIHEHDNGVTNFHFEIAGDILNTEELKLLGKMRPGLVQLEIGVQSTNCETLREIRRVMDMEKLKKVVAAIREGGNIHQHLDLIAGLPNEDYTSFAHSFNEVYAMHPDQLQLGFLKVLKGSYMYEMAKQYGLVYMDMPPYEVLYTKWISYEEVCRLKRIEEMVELYYNSNQFTHTLPVLEAAFQTPFALYEALAAYYEENGLFVETPSRLHRYQVLLAFASKVDKGKESLYRELLVYDLYLRENLKSRPDFAEDLGAYRKGITAFYKKEEEVRRFLPAYAVYDSKQLARMTHLEPFHYAVWKQGKEAAKSALGYVLFDYQKRSPLTHEARTVYIPAEQRKESKE